jgi:Ni,Fe-hydrogenase III large subunit
MRLRRRQRIRPTGERCLRRAQAARTELPVAYTLALRASAPALARPQRALLNVEGEHIVDVEYRPDAGDGSPFEHTDRLGLEQAVHTAMGCPHCGVAHGLALCQAIEALTGVSVPRRGAMLRLIAAELERASSHLETTSAIFAALGMPIVATAFATEGASAGATLRDLASDGVAGWLVPGGVARDLGTEERETLIERTADSLERIFTLADQTISRRTLLARTVEIGVISASAAGQYRLGGPLARGAGLRADLRHDAPYAAYDDWRPNLVTQEGGDVYARLMMFVLEALESLKLAGRVAGELVGGQEQSYAELPESLPAGSGEGHSEGPRGPVRYRVEAEGGRLSAVRCTLAPQLDRLLARTALGGAALDDAALIMISTDPCDICLGMANR